MSDQSEQLLKNGEKYALVALRTRAEVPAMFHASGPPELWASSESPVQLGDHWEKWLGTIRAEGLGHANLFLMAKTRSDSVEILDGENAELKKLVYWFHVGLLLSVRLTTFDDPSQLTGSSYDGQSSVREVGHLSRAAPIVGLTPETVTIDHLARAAAVASALQEWGSTGGSWRFNRVLQIYAFARANSDPLERIHQFSRCIDGLILPDAGRTRRQFMSRTETFIGPREHALMGSIYDIRSLVEHLREYEFLDPPSRPEREELFRKAALMEHLARHCIGRVLLTKSLWPHFSNPGALEGFWNLPPGARGNLWGATIDLPGAMSEFRGQYIQEADLGLT
jgi:hypothetical protein